MTAAQLAAFNADASATSHGLHGGKPATFRGQQIEIISGPPKRITTLEVGGTIIDIEREAQVRKRFFDLYLWTDPQQWEALTIGSDQMTLAGWDYDALRQEFIFHLISAHKRPA